MSKTRSFAKSNVNVADHLKHQEEVEKTLKLRRDYEEKFKKFEESFKELVKVVSPYADKVDFNDVLNADIFMKEYEDIFRAFIFNFGKEFTIPIYNSLEDPLPALAQHSHYNCVDRLKDLLYPTINGNVTNKLYILSINKVINRYLDAYEDVYNLDTRTLGEKSTSTKEYMSELKTKIKKDGASALKDIAKDAMKIIVDNAPSVSGLTEGAAKVALGMFAPVSNFGNLVYDWFKTEDQKEIEKQIKEDQEDNAIVEEIHNEVAVASNSDNTEIATISNYVQPISDDALKISDSKVKNNWHKQFQDKLSNYIDMAKISCFANAVKMHEEANTCDLQSLANASKECDAKKQSANFVMKNCDVIFPMQSNYDEIITKMLNYASEARVKVSENGDMLFLAAGKEASREDAFEGQDLNALPMPTTSDTAQLKIAGVVDQTADSNDGNLAIKAPQN